MPIVERKAEFTQADDVNVLTSMDGEFVVMEYGFGEEKARVGITSDQAAKMMHKLSEILTATLSQEGRDLRFVRMIPVVSAGAGATDEPGMVSLRLTDELGVPHYFAMPAQDSAALRPKLRSAEAASKSGERLPRA